MPASRTALVAPVPAVDPMLTAIEAAHPGVTRPGLPAHVTFLYPFVPTDSLDAAATDWLTGLAARQTRLSLTFPEVSIDNGFVYLASPQLKPLTDEIRAHWPDSVPYLGQFGLDPDAHISLAIDIADPTESLKIAGTAASVLAKNATVDELWLVANDNGQWQTQRRFPFTA